MPANGDFLAQTLQVKLANNYQQAYRVQSGGQEYAGPMSQSNPTYFMNFCTAIGKGIILGQPTIPFVTKDSGFTGAPARQGTGVGLGIMIDKDWMFKNLYIRLRQAYISAFGNTNFPEWPEFIPPFTDYPAQEYNFLHALCEAITDSVKEHHETLFVLNSTHPFCYSGVGEIIEGAFHSVQTTAIKEQIQNLGVQMQGQAWPILCQTIAEVYTETIHDHSEAEVVITGVCVPNTSQVCGLPITLVAGTGVAS